MTENENKTENQMDDFNEETDEDMDESYEKTELIMSQFLAAADVQAVYAEPIEQGDYLMIPAAEIMSVAGFGYGSGSGSGPDQKTGQMAKGGGAGGGGGGRIFSRPVAVIVAGPQGVEIQPVFDLTKVALAALTAFGFMFAAGRRMRRGKIH